MFMILDGQSAAQSAVGRPCKGNCIWAGSAALSLIQQGIYTYRYVGRGGCRSYIAGGLKMLIDMNSWSIDQKMVVTETSNTVAFSLQK